MATIGTSDFKKKLVNKFVPKNTEESKSKIVQDLYKKYKKSLSQPKLSPSNLISAMRYINKYNLKEADYQKAIDKTVSTSSMLTMSQFSKIYDYIMNKRNIKNALNRSNVLKIYDFMIDYIMKTVNKGDRIRFSHFGTFEGMTRKSRKYMIPNTKKTVTVKKHVVPKFRPSMVWKKQLRK